MAHRRWSDIKRDHLSPDQLAKVRTEVEVLSQELRLRELREMLHKTQTELAEVLGKTQESLSKTEGRADSLLSTIVAYVRALGGHLRIFAELDGTLYPLDLTHISRPTRTDKPSLRARSRRSARAASKAAISSPPPKLRRDNDTHRTRSRAA